MKTRLYTVVDTTNKDAEPRLIEAGNPAQAIRHATRGRFTAEVANAMAVAELVSDGVRVEKAAEEKAAEDNSHG